MSSFELCITFTQNIAIVRRTPNISARHSRLEDQCHCILKQYKWLFKMYEEMAHCYQVLCSNIKKSCYNSLWLYFLLRHLCNKQIIRNKQLTQIRYDLYYNKGIYNLRIFFTAVKHVYNTRLCKICFLFIIRKNKTLPKSKN